MVIYTSLESSEKFKLLLVVANSSAQQTFLISNSVVPNFNNCTFNYSFQVSAVNSTMVSALQKGIFYYRGEFISTIFSMIHTIFMMESKVLQTSIGTDNFICYYFFDRERVIHC